VLPSLLLLATPRAPPIKSDVADEGRGRRAPVGGRFPEIPGPLPFGFIRRGRGALLPRAHPRVAQRHRARRLGKVPSHGRGVQVLVLLDDGGEHYVLFMYLLLVMDNLDKLSLQSKQAISIPFVKKILKI